MLIAVARHSAAAGQNTVVLLIKPQRIDNLIEFALKGLGFSSPQWSNQVKKKAFPVRPYRHQMAQASSRCVYLLIVAITVLLL